MEPAVENLATIERRDGLLELVDGQGVVLTSVVFDRTTRESEKRAYARLTHEARRQGYRVAGLGDVFNAS